MVKYKSAISLFQEWKRHTFRTVTQFSSY